MSRLAAQLSPDAEFWRRLAYAGARHGPAAFLKYSPPVFGCAFAVVLPELRAVVRRNLRAARGARSGLQDELDVLRTFSAYAHCLAESLAGDRPEAQRADVRLLDEARVRPLLHAKEGLVLVTAHTGSWDAAARLLSTEVRREVIVVMAREPDARARALHDAVRRRGGIRVVHVGDHPLEALPLLRHLRDGGVVAIQLDRVPPGARSLEVRLLGQPYRVPEGPFSLAAMAGVPVLPLFARRSGFFAYELWSGEVLRLPRRPDRAVLRAAAAEATFAMERFIRAHPTQWFHFEAPK